MDRIGDMAAFVKVVEANGFSAAAPQLGLTPSAISKLVTRLEERLGVRLFNRTTRKLALTEAGEAFYRDAARIIADVAAPVVEEKSSSPAIRAAIAVGGAIITNSGSIPSAVKNPLSLPK